ncbi:hypothetical protein [Arthrobacter crystallopoietes]|nr:hypothetical protein [Arthrobacter crystallopoietes]
MTKSRGYLKLGEGLPETAQGLVTPASVPCEVEELLRDDRVFFGCCDAGV